MTGWKDKAGTETSATYLAWLKIDALWGSADRRESYLIPRERYTRE